MMRRRIEKDMMKDNSDEYESFNTFQYYYDPPDMTLDPELVQSIISENDTPIITTDENGKIRNINWKKLGESTRPGKILSIELFVSSALSNGSSSCICHTECTRVILNRLSDFSLFYGM